MVPKPREVIVYLASGLHGRRFVFVEWGFGRRAYLHPPPIYLLEGSCNVCFSPYAWLYGCAEPSPRVSDIMKTICR